MEFSLRDLKFEARRKRVWVDAKITEIRVPFDPRPLKYSSESEKDKVRKFSFLRTTGTRRYQRQFAVSFLRQWEYFIPVFLMGQTLTFDE